MTNNNRPFDVIFWGATGFTGQLVAEYMVRQYGMSEGSSLGAAEGSEPETAEGSLSSEVKGALPGTAKGSIRWAIAGRSAEKLAQIAEQVAGNDADKIPQLIANADDQGSLDALAEQTTVICTTVGPYAMYGEGLVKACVQAGTHYCDLTGEVHWMAEMIEQYQIQAEASGARIVHTCGFDSIPSDMGVHYLQKMMLERHGLPAKEASYRLVKMSGGMSGGTVASMMNMMEQMKEDPSIRDVMADPYSLNPANMPRGDDGPDQMGAEYDRHFKQWTAPFVMAGINTRVVRRTNALNGYSYGKDFRYSEAVLIGEGPGGYLKAGLTAGVTGLMMLLTTTSTGRSLMNRFVPQPGEGPSKDARENGSFVVDILGIHPTDSANNMKVRVTGDKDPGYGSTSKMIAESAISLAIDDLETEGGFWTPASAMGDHLLERLEDNAGMTFTVLE